jgi:hypothetical protein
MRSIALVVVALLGIAACGRGPKQPDPNEGYTLETTGAAIGVDVPQQRAEPDATVGEVATRLASQICEREARCHGGGPVSDQCMSVFSHLAALEVVTWPCSPAAIRSRAKECLASLNAEPCEMNLATKPALCLPSPACPEPSASLVPTGAVLAQQWPSTGAPTFDRGAAISALDAIDVRPCIAKATEEGVVSSQPPDQTGEPELKVSRPARTTAHISVTFAPDGSVLTSRLDRGPDGSAVNLWGTAAGQCMVEQFRGARVPLFQGEPQRVGVSIRLE